MGDLPWNRSEGRYDRPSSSVPLSRHQERQRRAERSARHGFVEQHLADAKRAGVIATGVGTILARIDLAIRSLKDDGHGDCALIYLTDTDLMAFREATGKTDLEYRDAIVRPGSKSKCYSKRGVARAVRKKLPR